MMKRILLLWAVIVSLAACPVKAGVVDGPSPYSLVPVVISSADITLTTDQCKGGYIEITAAKTVTLPAGFSGMNLIVRSSGANAVSVNPSGSEVIVLNGTALAGGNKITSTSTANDFVTMVHNGTNWIVIGASTWTDGGA